MSVPSTLTLKVVWPGGTHIVMVDVLVEPPLAHMTQAGKDLDLSTIAGGVLPQRRHDFDEDVLYNDASFARYLRDWTINAQPGSPVLAQIVSTRVPRLLERARVVPPIQGPIEIRLP